MTLTKARRTAPPLDPERLQELALNYVSRYATTRAKLGFYLARKVRERGWSGDRQPDLLALADRFADLGYIDDAAYALNTSRSLAARGYGKRRLAQKLRIDGVDDRDGTAAHAHAQEEVVDAALRFAARKRIGPYSSAPVDPRQREKWIAAMVRAGHSFVLARAVAALSPGAQIDRERLAERAGVAED